MLTVGYMVVSIERETKTRFFCLLDDYRLRRKTTQTDGCKGGFGFFAQSYLIFCIMQCQCKWEKQILFLNGF